MSVKKAAAYSRALCPMYGDQQATLRQYAEEQALELVRVYHDHVTDLDYHHPALDALLLEAEQGVFEVVIVLCPARLGLRSERFRQVRDLLEKAYGVKLHLVLANCQGRGVQ